MKIDIMEHAKGSLKHAT